MSTRTIDELGAMKTPVVIGMKRKILDAALNLSFSRQKTQDLNTV